MKTTNHEMMNRFFPDRGNMAPDPRHGMKGDDSWMLEREMDDMDEDKMEARMQKMKARSMRR